MKSQFLLLSILLLLSGCGDSSSGNKDKKIKDKKESEEGITIEGTLVKISNFIMPSAYAEVCNGIDDDCDGLDDDCDGLVDESIRLYDKLECFPKSECKGLVGEKCVFLLDQNFKPLANGVVINGNYSFKVKLDEKKDYLILKAEDYDDKNFHRKLIFDKDELKEKLKINPESTISSEIKKDFILKKQKGEDVSKEDLENNITQAIDKIKEDIGIEEDGLKILANSIKGKDFFVKEIKKIIDGIIIEVKELFDIVVTNNENTLKDASNEDLLIKYNNIKEDVYNNRDIIDNLKKEKDEFDLAYSDEVRRLTFRAIEVDGLRRSSLIEIDELINERPIILNLKDFVETKKSRISG